MKVLITGSNGLLGQKLVDRLVGIPGFEVIASSLHENVIPYVFGYDFVQLDICNAKHCEDVILNLQPDAIINTAAVSHADVCEENPRKCDEINVEAVRILGELANKVGAHFIHLSTDFVFDGKAGLYREDDLPSPLNYYGKSKLKSENWVASYCKSWAIVRTVQVYGVNFNMSRSNLVLWVKKSLEEGKPIRVVDDQYRTPTFVEDLADGIFRILNLKAQGIYNISGDEYLSVYDVAVKTAQIFDLPVGLISPISTEELNEKARRPLCTGFNIEKAKEILGYTPISLKEGLGLMKEQLSNIGSH